LAGRISEPVFLGLKLKVKSWKVKELEERKKRGREEERKRGREKERKRGREEVIRGAESQPPYLRGQVARPS